MGMPFLCAGFGFVAEGIALLDLMTWAWCAGSRFKWHDVGDLALLINSS
jgi:hypothetical protein